MCSERIRLYKCDRPIVGDLVLIENDAVNNYSSNENNDAANEEISVTEINEDKEYVENVEDQKVSF